jgi:hypothetical protein
MTTGFGGSALVLNIKVINLLIASEIRTKKKEVLK